MEETKTLPNYITDKNRQVNNSTDGLSTQDDVETVDAAVTKPVVPTTVPKTITNQIVMNQALQRNEKYRQEAESFTNTIIQDNATKEILDEAEADTNLSNFDFGDISEYLTKLEDLSFLEAVSYKKKIDAEIARWKSCKSTLDMVAELELDDNINRELMRINAVEHYQFSKTVEDFESHYLENVGKLDQISAKLVAIINHHKHEMDSTKFLTDEMIHLMKNKINKLDPENLNYTYNKTRMETVVNAFENRKDIEYLVRKLTTYLKTNHGTIKKYLRDDAKILNNVRSGGKRTKIINDLLRFFNESIVNAMFVELQLAFDDDLLAVYLMMGFIAKIMNTERKTAQDIWGKVFALNLSDINNDIFDIEEEEETPYTDKITDVIYPILEEYLKPFRKTVKLSRTTRFGL